jgi:hypothetical protein
MLYSVTHTATPLHGLRSGTSPNVLLNSLLDFQFKTPPPQTIRIRHEYQLRLHFRSMYFSPLLPTQGNELPTPYAWVFKDFLSCAWHRDNASRLRLERTSDWAMLPSPKYDSILSLYSIHSSLAFRGFVFPEHSRTFYNLRVDVMWLVMRYLRVLPLPTLSFPSVQLVNWNTFFHFNYFYS